VRPRNHPYRFRIVAAVGLAVAIALSIASPAMVADHDRTGSDSIDVLLLSTPAVDHLMLSGEGLWIDGRIQRNDRIELRAAGDTVVGEGVRASAVSVAGGAITIASDARERRVSGTVRVSARRGALVAVARIALTDYLAGTLATESSASDPLEYRVALAVLQRNYARAHRGRHAPDADLCDNTHCQLFHGVAGAARTREAVRRSAAISLAHDDALPCYYSANCGGASLTPDRVWGRIEPGYASVRCIDCRNARWHRWTREVRASDEASRIFAAAPRTPFIDDDFKIRAGRALGFDVVPSNTVDRIERRGGVYRISGRGFGHRVGLCQDGARALASRGRSASEILQRYFPAAAVTHSP
jgi:stage II sporulation protein D